MAARRSNTGEALDYRAQTLEHGRRPSAAAWTPPSTSTSSSASSFSSTSPTPSRSAAPWCSPNGVKKLPEDRGRVHRREHLLGAARRALVRICKNQAHQPTIGTVWSTTPWPPLSSDNPALRDVLPKDYARPALDKTRLGQVIDMVSNIKVGGAEAQRHGCPRQRLRVLPGAVRPGRGPQGRRVLYPAQRCAGSSSKCSSPTRAAFTTPAAAPPACSSSPSSSSRPTPPATATPSPDLDHLAPKQQPLSPSTARSPTTPPGAWPA